MMLGCYQVGRRAFVKGGTLMLATSAVGAPALGGMNDESIRVGLVTDLHYADKPAAGSRYYRETLQKLSRASSDIRGGQPAFFVELGDLVDAADSIAIELGYLEVINEQLKKICAERHYVLGNHCVHTLTKREFLECVDQPKSYYSFDHGPFHFIVLDACFRADGVDYGRKNFEWTDSNIPEQEVRWLEEDLANTNKKTIVFAHQRLDVSNAYGVKNAIRVRSVLEHSEKVLAVFQGHSHKNDYHEIGGIHYCTLVAMVEGSGDENNAYSLLQLAADGTIQLQGWLKQNNYQWPAHVLEIPKQ